MNHFKKEEWILFVKDLINDNKKIKMEDHLLECDECLNLYLQAVEEIEIPNTKDLLNHELIENVINEIKKETKPTNISKLLTYYTCAACITLVLISSGFFDFVKNELFRYTDSAMTIASSQLVYKKYIDSNISEKLVDKTSNVLDILIKGK